MYTIDNIGKFETLPLELIFVYNSDIEGIENKLKRRMNINKRFFLSEYISLSMLELAVYTENEKMIVWLIEHGASLHEKYRPIVLTAVRYLKGDMLKYIIDKGGLTELTEDEKKEIFNQIGYGKKYENIKTLEENGIKVSKYGGDLFFSLSLNEKTDMNIIETLYSMGADINYNKNEYNHTPLMNALIFKNDELALWLIEHKAYISIKDKDGERAYTIAISKNNLKLAKILKELEPKEWHDENIKLKEIEKYNMPNGMIEFLRKDEPIMIFSNKCEMKHIRFFNITDTIDGKWKRKNCLYISAEIKNYNKVKIVWMENCLYAIDTEHEKTYMLGGWAEFYKNAENIITEKIFL